jgi:kinetochore protein Spc7/SPC105
LKKYISEGRNIVKEIESDTYEDNPLLFREYMSATPQVRAIMDNQFKNVKTHARLLSKAMWYEWRMKLLDGLREGLVRIKDGLDKDEKVITKQARLVEPIVPGLVEEHDRLKAVADGLQQQADELADCDPEELQQARNDLSEVDEQIEAMKSQVKALQWEMDEKEQAVTSTQARKTQCQQDIEDAERTLEQYRGWSTTEVAALKGKSISVNQSSCTNNL